MAAPDSVVQPSKDMLDAQVIPAVDSPLDIRKTMQPSGIIAIFGSTIQDFCAAERRRRGRFRQQPHFEELIQDMTRLI